VFENNDMFGDGVDIASRLQALHLLAGYGFLNLLSYGLITCAFPSGFFILRKPPLSLAMSCMYLSDSLEKLNPPPSSDASIFIDG